MLEARKGNWPTHLPPNTPKELQMDMNRITSRGVYCVRPDLTQGIVEMPSGFMVPDPYTQGTSDVRSMNRDRIAAHAHCVNPNTPVAMGIHDTVSDLWATALGWWFAGVREATLKAQSVGSVVYTS